MWDRPETGRGVCTKARGLGAPSLAAWASGGGACIWQALDGGDVQRVLVLEDDDDLRGLLCDLLVGAGAQECVSAGSFDAMVGKKEQVLGCGLALLDVNLGSRAPSGLDA